MYNYSAVCEYTGELIRGHEMKVREKVYMAAGLYYLFDLEVDRFCSMPWCVDATRKGNVARFVNHRCGDTSNCQIRCVCVWLGVGVGLDMDVDVDVDVDVGVGVGVGVGVV